MKSMILRALSNTKTEILQKIPEPIFIAGLKILMVVLLSTSGKDSQAYSEL